MTGSAELPTYSVIYAFGDSLSDAGNVSILAEAVGVTPASPPYYQEIDYQTVPLLGRVPVPVADRPVRRGRPRRPTLPTAPRRPGPKFDTDH